MMLAPRWALHAQAIDAAGAPHLAAGIHLRAMPSAGMGLPVAPLMVYRRNLGPGASRISLRTESVWVDSLGATLIPPFTVTANNPVTGFLPSPSQGVCCWIQVDATAGSALRVAATVTTPLGPGVVATRSAAPYILSAARIEQVLVTGTGTVQGVHWVNATTLMTGEWQPWRLLALPVRAGARYAGVANHAALAQARVRRGAPIRFGLNDVPTAAGPAACPAATQDDEWLRVSANTAQIDAYLGRLTNDLSQPPWKQTETHPLYQGSKNLGKAEIPLLGYTLTAGLDPGYARWLGLMDRDEAPLSATAGDVLAYAIRGIWMADKAALDKALYAMIPPSELQPSLPHLNFGNIPVTPADLPGATPPFLDLWAIACATVGTAVDLPTPPVTGPPAALNWLPATPPKAIREVKLPFLQMPLGASLALTRKQGAVITGLNTLRNKRAVPLTLSVPPGAPDSGRGDFHDRTAPPGAFTYRTAQADWFGRWSGWAEKAGPPKNRPRPPQPILTISYTQPDPGSPMKTGPLSGMLRVQVSVPQPEALSPGSNLLASLTIFVDNVATVVPIADPNNPPEELVAKIAGPAIDQADARDVTIFARWRDTAAVYSDDSNPTTMTLFDPRPPAQLDLPLILEYGSRPDVTGKSRIMLKWQSAKGQNAFRIFYADETGVTAKLAAIAGNAPDPDHQAAADLLDNIKHQNAPKRAAFFKGAKHLLRRLMFELLTADALPNPHANGVGPMTYAHAVSGSLRVLSFYRIVGVSKAQVEADFITAPLLPYGVPNTVAPAQPMLDVRPRIDPQSPIPYAVEATIRIAQGEVAARQFRIRRSTAAVTDPLHLPVVATGAVPALAPGDERQKAVFTDTGAWLDVAPGAQLQPWQAYYYQAEVQGDFEPGSQVPGQWSAASPVAVATLIPPDPPPAVQAVQVGKFFMKLAVSFSLPAPLVGGSMGTYTLDLYRQLPGESEQFLTSFPGGNTWYNYLDDLQPSRTRYRVVVTDPIGRSSAPSPATVLP